MSRKPSVSAKWSNLTFLPTFDAKFTNKPLVNDDPQRHRDLVIAQSKISQGRDRTDRVSRVKGAENHMPCNSSGTGDLSRLRFTQFADHRVIWITTQDSAHSFRKIQTVFDIHLNLIDPVDLVLHRIFNRHDVKVMLSHFVQNGIDGRGLSTPSRSGHQKHPIQFIKPIAKAPQTMFVQAQFLNTVLDPLWIEQTNGNLWATDAGNYREPVVEFVSIDDHRLSRSLGSKDGRWVNSHCRLELINQSFPIVNSERRDIMYGAINAKTYCVANRYRIDVYISCASLNRPRNPRDLIRRQF